MADLSVNIQRSGGRSVLGSQEANGKTLLTQSDFTYLGAFDLPRHSGVCDMEWGKGLAARYVGENLRFFCYGSGVGHSSDVVEVSYPGIATSAPYPVATAVRTWGDIGYGVRWNAKYGLNSEHVYGLYWDAIDSRLYWTYGKNYGDTSSDQTTDRPCFGYSTLNDDTGIATPVGCWGVEDQASVGMQWGICALPSWFGNAYCAGRRLAIGFGGYMSAVADGPPSAGPAIAAIDVPNIGTNPDHSNLNNTPIIYHPWNEGNPFGARLPDSIFSVGSWSPATYPAWGGTWTGEDSGWLGYVPVDGLGYWGCGHEMQQTSVWIDTQSKSGWFGVYAGPYSNAHVWYEQSDRRVDKYSHYWFLVSPTTLAESISNPTSPLTLNTSHWTCEGQWTPYEYTGSGSYPGTAYPTQCTGVTYDATQRRVYLSMRFMGGTSDRHRVYVYEVAN